MQSAEHVVRISDPLHVICNMGASDWACNVDGFMLCFYKNTDHVFNYILLMQTTTSGIPKSTGKSKHNKNKSSSITYQESTTTTAKRSAAAYLRMRVRMQLHLKKKKYE